MKNRTPLPRIGKWRIIPLEARPWLGGGHNRILCDWGPNALSDTRIFAWVVYLPFWKTWKSVGIIIPSIWISLSTSLSTSCNLVIVFLVDTVWALALWNSGAPDALQGSSLHRIHFVKAAPLGRIHFVKTAPFTESLLWRQLGRATLESGATNGRTQGTHERFIYADISIFNLIINIYLYLNLCNTH